MAREAGGSISETKKALFHAGLDSSIGADYLFSRVAVVC